VDQQLQPVRREPAQRPTRCVAGPGTSLRRASNGFRRADWSRYYVRGMADPPPWPSYPIGPPGAALAIGVASVNYARLEFAFGHMFATVTGVTNEEAWRLLPTLRNPERIRRIRKALRECDWPPDTKDRVNHFIDAFKILTDNRNLLDHSNVFELDEEGLCTRIRWLYMLWRVWASFAKQPCGSAPGREPGRCGRRCRGEYRRLRAVCGAD